MLAINPYETSLTELSIESKISPSDPLLRRALFEIHKGTCFYTRAAIVFEEMAVEHIHPRARGWNDAFVNYFPSCKSVNSLKWAKYDSIATNELLQINRLLYAPRVLERYKELVRLSERVKQKNHKGFPNPKIITPKTSVVAYGGWTFIQSLLDATLWKIDYIRIVGSRYPDIYRFIAGRSSSNSGSLVDEHFASDRIQELFKSEIYLDEHGTLFELSSAINITWWANLMTTSGTHGENELDISINLDFYFPKDSYGYKYINWLKAKVESFLKN